MIIRVWGEVDGVEIPLRPLKDKPDYWYGYCDWSPNLLHMELWAENDRGARGHFDGFVKIQYIGNAKTKCRLVLYPYVIRLMRDGLPFADAGRSHRMLESETFLCGEDRRVSIAINSTDRHPFEIVNARWSLINGDTIEASGYCEVHAIRSDYTVLKAKIQPMIANNVYTLRFGYDVNDEHLEQDVTVRVK